MVKLGAEAGVHGDLASHDEAVLEQLSDVLAYKMFRIKFRKLKSKRHTIPH